MTLDELIEKLQDLKSNGAKGDKLVYSYDHESGYIELETVRVDLDGDVIMSE